MKKKIIMFVAGIFAIVATYTTVKKLTKDVANDILNLDDDLEF